MGKRSAFARRPADDYATPFAAVPPLVPYLHAEGIRTFAEPCCGDGDLCSFLEFFGFDCVLANDLRYGADARRCGAEIFEDADAIITNPPWSRELLHPLIWHFSRIKPCWLLFDADWAHTKQASALLSYCTDIVAIGRVKWIADSPFTGKDNAAWHRFQRERAGGAAVPWEEGGMTIPRQLSLLKGVRRQGDRPPTASEFQTQCAVADRLAWGLKDGWFYSHIGHGERRERSAAIRLKRGGLRPGLPDFIIVGPSETCGFYFLELKRRPNGLTQEQKIFCDVARSARGTFAIAYDVDEAVEILAGWGCLRGITAE